MSASGRVRPGFFTSPPMKERSAQPSYVHMIAISAVPISERLRPPCHAGVKWDTPLESAVNASNASAASAPNLAMVVRFITTAALLTPT